MTLASDLPNDPQYRRILDHGFIYVVDTMGSDASIVQAARTSYGAGTKTVNEDRGLIRYLIRNQHSTPVEMAVVKFHIKMPIFVCRQHIRHRMSTTNEYSGRYSEMTDAFYVPELKNIKPQSKDNKQGRDGDFSAEELDDILMGIKESYRDSYIQYEHLLNQNVARELSRVVLPVGNYTELYWKIDLHNLFKYLKLRMDLHAQLEIRLYAEAMYDLIKPLFPLACEAAEDYIFKAKTFSRMELSLLENMMQKIKQNSPVYFTDTTAEEYGLSKREFIEFKHKLGL